MKKAKTFLTIALSILILSGLYSCNKKVDKPANQTKTENTLKSISLWQDSTGVDPAQLFADLEKVNNAIDSIGYPDAGYKLWEVNSDDSLNFRFMVEGSWPDQETYQLIHDHELYKKATENENTTWTSLKNTWYYRFDRVN